MSGIYDKWRLADFLVMIESDTQNAANAHLQAWQDKFSLLLVHRQKLESLAAELATHWNPSTSEAAEAFINKIEFHINLLDAASKAVAQTWGGLVHITDAIADAKTELHALRQHYNDPTAAAQEFNRRVPFMPNGISAKYPALPVFGMEDLAMRQHQDRLDERAREIMSATDLRVGEAAAMIKSIPAMDLIDGGAQYDPVSNPGTISSNRGGGSYVPTPAFNPPPSSVLSAPAATFPPLDDGAGLVLTGGPAAVTLPLADTSISRNSPVSSPLSEPAGTWPGAVSRPTTSGLIRAGDGTVVLRPGGVIGGDGMLTRPNARGLPVNGVLGGAPPAESAVPGGGIPLSGAGGAIRGYERSTSGGTNRPTPRVGILGSEPAVVSRTSGGGWRDQSFELYVERCSPQKHGDPESMWEVAEGVAPVLEARQPPVSHDAGAGVIGIDR